MGGFSVDPTALAAFGKQVDQICTDLSAASAPSDISDGEAGTRSVGRALREFHDHWKQQQSTMLSNLNALGKTIGDAAQEYQQSDQAVSAGAEGGSQSS